MAALLSVAVTWLESRSDTVKLCLLLQRPIPKRSSNAGVWEYVLVVQSWLAVLSNVLLFSFASDQLAVLVPECFHVVGTHTRRGVSSHVYQWKAGEGRDVVATMWLLEHLVLALALAVWLLEHLVLALALAVWLGLSSLSNSMRTRVARKRYLEAQAARGVDLRRAQRTRAGKAVGGAANSEAVPQAEGGEKLARHLALLRLSRDGARVQGDKPQ
jgi:hypothetical protein